jgi:hypothetical protein
MSQTSMVDIPFCGVPTDANNCIKNFLTLDLKNGGLKTKLPDIRSQRHKILQSMFMGHWKKMISFESTSQLQVIKL